MENTSKSRAPISKALRYKIFERDSYTCQYCGRRPPDVVLHVDHRTPVSRGGTNEEMNLLTACSDCNGGKGARMPGDISPTPDASSRTARIAQEASEYEQYLKHSRLRDEYLKKAVQAIQGLWHQSAQGTVVPNESVIIGWIHRYGVNGIDEAIRQATLAFSVGKISSTPAGIRGALAYVGAIARRHESGNSEVN